MASSIDEGLFVLHGKENHLMAIATVVLYVDDVIIIANKGFMGKIKCQMKEWFQMHNFQSVSCYCSIDI